MIDFAKTIDWLGSASRTRQPLENWLATRLAAAAAAAAAAGAVAQRSDERTGTRSICNCPARLSFHFSAASPSLAAAAPPSSFFLSLLRSTLQWN